MSKSASISGLVMDMHQGETIALGHNIKIEFLSKSGRRTRVRIIAPAEVKIKKESDGKDSQHPAQRPTF